MTAKDSSRDQNTSSCGGGGGGELHHKTIEMFSSLPEELESPKSAAAAGRWTAKDINLFVHSQVLRIRQEDSHLGEDIGEGLSANKDKLQNLAPHPRDDIMLFSRPILPSSPLSGKVVIKTVH